MPKQNKKKPEDDLAYQRRRKSLLPRRAKQKRNLPKYIAGPKRLDEAGAKSNPKVGKSRNSIINKSNKNNKTVNKSNKLKKNNKKKY